MIKNGWIYLNNTTHQEKKPLPKTCGKITEDVAISWREFFGLKPKVSK